MDKEKEIEEIANILRGYVTDEDEARNTLAYLIVANGYGNVKQAVKEFADYVRQVIVKQFSDNETEKLLVCGALKLLYEHINELYGEE